MTPAIRNAIIDAYKRHEDAAGGYHAADHTQCVARAAEECNVRFEQARGVMLDHWSGANHLAAG